ncbi:MAG TPA: cation-transporting P-type ATPase [Natronosporangium sp.]|nr:cation-transporting P-type ATPase [Natronosporangium sp.]
MTEARRRTPPPSGGRGAGHGGTARAGFSSAAAASMPVDEVLAALASEPDGLSESEADRRRAEIGPNAVRTHQVSAWRMLVRQLRSALLGLLVVAAWCRRWWGKAPTRR